MTAVGQNCELPERKEPTMLKAGFATTCITPPPGKDIPGLFERRLAQGTHDDLYVRAAVIDDGTSCVALVQTDTIKVSEELVAGARKQAQRLCGIPGKNCFIASTHTHSGGPVFAGFMAQGDPDYPPFVATQVAAAIAQAHRTRRPAFVGTEADKAEGVAYNRRFWMKDGSQKTHPGKMNPNIVEAAGPADPTVTVVTFRSPDDLKPFGSIVTFACHATHMNGLLYSADYPKYVIDTIQAVHGPDYGVVYLNGACGDVTQVDNRSPRPGEFGPYWTERSGRIIGAGALQAIARTDYVSKATVSADAAKVRVAIRESTPAARKAARALLAKKAVTASDVETIYAQELLKVEALRKARPYRVLEIMGVRIADAFFWGVPGEFFQAFAMNVRDHSAFPHTCCVELANGYNGYICTEDAFEGGGYEIRTARSSLLEPRSGAKVVRVAKRLSTRMARDVKRELAALPNRRVWSLSDDSALDGINQITKKKRKK
jgi:hypothetical protein